MMTRRSISLLLAGTLALAVFIGLKPSGDESRAADSTGKAKTIIKYGDGKPDGKKSIAGTGEMVRFELPDESQKLLSVRIHCARYGAPQAPRESAEFSIVSDDGSEVVHQEDVPYSSFKRGASRWTTIRFEEPGPGAGGLLGDPRFRRPPDQRRLCQLRHEHRR